jgi:hypothetical protein
MKRATEEEHAPRSHTGPETLTNADEAPLHFWKTLSTVGISWPAVIMPLHTIRCHSLRSLKVNALNRSSANMYVLYLDHIPLPQFFHLEYLVSDIH